MVCLQHDSTLDYSLAWVKIPKSGFVLFCILSSSLLNICCVSYFWRKPQTDQDVTEAEITTPQKKSKNMEIFSREKETNGWSPSSSGQRQFDRSILK